MIYCSSVASCVSSERPCFRASNSFIKESSSALCAANASGDAIRFSFLNNCNGVFNYYGLDDHLSDTSGDSGPYTIVANFLDSTKWDVGNNDSRIEKVEWITPTVNTMINTDKDIVISDNKKELSFYMNINEATINEAKEILEKNEWT